MTSRRLWTEDEIDYLKNTLDKSIGEVAVSLDRSYTSVLAKRKKLELHSFYYCSVCNEMISQKGKYCTEHNWIARTIAQTKNHCKNRGRDYELDDAEAIEMLMSDCTYCGGKGGGIDRVDSSLGYTADNTVPCCYTCNAMKLDTPLDQWMLQMKRILENYNG